MRKLSGALLATAVLLTGISACSSDAPQQGFEARYSVVGALAELPWGHDGPITIHSADLTAATEAAGLERPTDLQGEALHEWLMPVQGFPLQGADPAPIYVPLATLFNGARLGDHQEFADELGWSLLETERFAELATPPRTFTVVAGDFDDSTLASDLHEIGDGVVSAGEGEDLANDFDSVTVARPHGAPLRLAQAGGLIAAGVSTDAVSAWASGENSTLADHAELAAVGAALDRAEVASAMLVSGAPMSLSATLGGSSPEAADAASAELGPVLPADPFETVGIGWGADGAKSVITVAYYFGSAGAAKDAVPVFERQFAEGSVLGRDALSDFLGLEDADHSDRVVVLTLSVADGISPGVISEMLLKRDLPFLHL